MEILVFLLGSGMVFAGFLFVVQRVLGRANLPTALVGYLLWLILSGAFAYSLFQRWTAEAIAAGLNNIGIAIAAGFAWAMLAGPAALLGALLLWFVRRSQAPR